MKLYIHRDDSLLCFRRAVIFPRTENGHEISGVPISQARHAVLRN